MRAPLVILDVDGVLVDALAAHVEAYRYACREMGLPLPQEGEVRRLMGLGADEMAVRLGCPRERVGEFVDGFARPGYAAILSARIPFAGVPDTLAALREGGTRIAALDARRDRAARARRSDRK